jgi:hypothetical protein
MARHAGPGAKHRPAGASSRPGGGRRGWAGQRITRFRLGVTAGAGDAGNHDDGDVGVGDGLGLGVGVGDTLGEGLGDGVGAHATQNTFCLAKPFSPVKFQKSL